MLVYTAKKMFTPSPVVCNSTKTSPVDLDILHLVKLTSRSSSSLVAHRQCGRSSSNPTESERIFSAFKKFEQQDPRLFLVHCCKAISPNLKMHNDVCSLALENRTILIILQFHKQWTLEERVYAYRHRLRKFQEFPSNNNTVKWQYYSLGVLMIKKSLHIPCCNSLDMWIPCESLGQPAALGTFILGVDIPDGPPLGSSLVYKLEIINAGLLVPAKFALSGLTRDLFSVRQGNSGFVFGVPFFPALYCRFPLRDDLSLSLSCVAEVSLKLFCKSNAGGWASHLALAFEQ